MSTLFEVVKDDLPCSSCPLVVECSNECNDVKIPKDYYEET